MLIALQFQTFDGEFVERLRSGDLAAGERFASYFGDVLHLKLRVRLRVPDLMEDILQTTLLRVLHIVRQGSGIRDPEKFGAFVNKVCDHVIQEHYRSELRYEPWESSGEEPADDSVDMDAALVIEDLRAVIEEVIGALPKRDGLILRAVYLEERDKAAICAEFGIEQSYLRVLQHRARVHFRNICEARGHVARLTRRQG